MPTDRKAIERWFLDAFREQLPEFPDGVIEASEKPDFIVAGHQGKIGIEVTSLHQESRSPYATPQQEGESERIVREAQIKYEQINTTPVWVHIYFSHHAVFSRQTRDRFIAALANLVIANIPCANGSVELDNPYTDLERFPIEFDRVEIERRDIITYNCWFNPSGGAVHEHFAPTLQASISQKEKALRGYNPACSEQWLLVVAEGMTPSTLFDPAESTLKHQYRSSFDRVFLLDAFRRKQWELGISPPSSDSA